MDRTILFFDIDGTVAEWDYIPESTAKALAAAKERGHWLIVNTGRTRASINRQVRSLPFDGYISGCGNHIYLGEEALLSSSLSQERCQEIVDLLRENGVPAFFEAEDQIYFDSRACAHNSWLDRVKKSFGIRGLGQEIEETGVRPFDKFLVFPRDRETEEKLEREFSRDLHCFHSADGVWEVIQKGYSKATGIDFLCERLQVDPKDCYAFGDSVNDVDMLQAVGTGIAMGNGDPRIFPHAAYRTSALREDGIARALEHFGLISRRDMGA